MTWGRKRAKETEKADTSSRREMPLFSAANAVMVVGALACVLFFCTFVGATPREISYPTVSSEAAVAAFLSEHTAFADVIGIDEYFVKPSISVGGFSERGEAAYRAFVEEAKKNWTFGEYLRDAFRALFETP